MVLVGGVDHRKFNGKWYIFVDYFTSKKEAKQKAEWYRRRGFLARVIKENGIYKIYKRG